MVCGTAPPQSWPASKGGRTVRQQNHLPEPVGEPIATSDSPYDWVVAFRFRGVRRGWPMPTGTCTYLSSNTSVTRLKQEVVESSRTTQPEADAAEAPIRPEGDVRGWIQALGGIPPLVGRAQLYMRLRNWKHQSRAHRRRQRQASSNWKWWDRKWWLVQRQNQVGGDVATAQRCPKKMSAETKNARKNSLPKKSWMRNTRMPRMKWM